MLILPLMGVSPQKIVVDDDVLSPIVILWVACGAFFFASRDVGDEKSGGKKRTE